MVVMDFEFKSLDFYRKIPGERWACSDSVWFDDRF